MTVTFMSCMIIAFICLVLFVMVWYIESKCSLILTPFLIVMAYEFVHIMPGFMLAIVRGVSVDCYAMLVFFTGFISLLVGFIISLICLGYHSSLPPRYLKRSITIDSEAEILVAIVGCMVILISAGFYLYQGLPSVANAFWGVISGVEANEMAEYVTLSRKEITKSYHFGGVYRGQGIILSFIRVGWPFLVSLAFITYWKTRKIRWLFIVIILFILSFIFVAGDGTRAPFVNTLIIYIILISLMKKVNLRIVVIACIVLISFGIVQGLYSTKMNYLLNSDKFVASAVLKIVDRITSGNSRNDVYAIEFVRSGIIEHRRGMVHLRDTIAVFPGKAGGLPFSNELALLLNPTGSRTTYASGTYITKPYVDFGITGVCVIFIFLGYLIGFSQKNIFAMEKKDPFGLAIAAMLSYFTGLVVLNSIMGIVSNLLIFILFCTISKMLMMFYSNVKGYIHAIGYLPGRSK